jgi:pyruvate/2-oxoglutarate dehydrogenase complex dihydrolipoamide acyltransferase (E2) component
MTDVILDPALFEAIEAGPDAYVEAWCVAEGDHVHAGQTLARANLVHSSVDVTASHAGIVEEIVVAAGERFAPGAVLARLVAT